MDWKEIIICVVTLVVGGFVALQFKSFKQWLVYACSESEEYFGSGSGQLKLRYVYNLAVESKFGFITKIITFKMFSNFVDGALVKMREMIENSPAIAEILSGTKVIDVEEVSTVNLREDGYTNFGVSNVGYVKIDEANENVSVTLKDGTTENLKVSYDAKGDISQIGDTVVNFK